VLGAHPDDYARAAPYHSYIHVDEFASPQELAKFLYYIDKNDSAFNTYFAWKSSGFISDKTYFLCRLCMMVHEEDNIRNDMQIKKESETLQTSCSKTRWVSSQTMEQHVAKLSQN
jgi:glycoprotein 3-alpha-L-fucosyltransferase